MPLSIRIGGIEMQLPDDRDPLTRQQIECELLMECAFELLHGDVDQLKWPLPNMREGPLGEDDGDDCRRTILSAKRGYRDHRRVSLKYKVNAI
jgi:hypothetical protein